MKFPSIPSAAILAALILCLFSCSSKETSKVVPSQEIIEGIKSGIADLSDKFPVECGNGLVLTEADFDDDTNSIMYKYQFTVPLIEKPTEEKIAAAKKAVLTMAKTQPDQIKLLDQGITYHYDYYSLDNEFLYSIEIKPEDLKD